MSKEEIWKPIKGYEDAYEVSNLGNVRSIDRYYEQRNKKCEKYLHIYKGKVLKQFKSNAGYMRVQLSYKYKSSPKTVHKLVAEAFLDNPNNYSCVNHIDGNKENNCVDNLEWCTYSHNNREAIRMGLNKGFKGTTYKKRCELAIEYIEHEYFKRVQLGVTNTDFQKWQIEDVLSILKGENNE